MESDPNQHGWQCGSSGKILWARTASLCCLAKLKSESESEQSSWPCVGSFEYNDVTEKCFDRNQLRYALFVRMLLFIAHPIGKVPDL